jgi:hypothetical protein
MMLFIGSPNLALVAKKKKEMSDQGARGGAETAEGCV